MSKWLRRSAVVLGALLLVNCLVGAGFYRAATSLPPEYQAALQVEPEQLEEDGQELESQLSALYSEAQRKADPEASQGWEAAVTDNQINGWLATRLNEEFPEAHKQGVIDPRVVFTEEGLTLAFRIERSALQAVVTFRVAPYLTEEGELGIDFAEARVGKVPLPVGRIVELSRAVFTDAGLPIRWSESDNTHTMLIDFEKLASDPISLRSLSAIEYGDGTLYIAGKTERRGPKLAQRVTQKATDQAGKVRVTTEDR
ncbi:MAG: hypothetical protein KDA37_16390 [Planctomycetales bacterium]|nr:hypothetical protein [Planctomycetales bacterium]